MSERRIETTLGALAIVDIGHGPATILWPSLYVDHVSMMPIADELARTRRCILIDGPGHGRSAVPAREFTLWDCARATEQVLDALAIPEVDWIGNAWGGHVGVCAAITSPRRLRTLIAIGSPMNAASTALRWKTRMGLACLALGARDLVGTLVAKALLAPTATAAQRAYVRSCIRDAPAGGLRRAVHAVSLQREDFMDQLPKVSVPTLFIAGAEDPLCPVDATRRQADAVPDARFEIVKGAAHLVPLEQPAETLRLILEFFAARSRSAA